MDIYLLLPIIIDGAICTTKQLLGVMDNLTANTMAMNYELETLRVLNTRNLMLLINKFFIVIIALTMFNIVYEYLSITYCQFYDTPMNTSWWFWHHLYSKQ